MPRVDIYLEEAVDQLDMLMRAVDGTYQWRERVLLSHGVKPPTSYYRVLLWLYVASRKRPDEAPTLLHLARSVGLTLEAARSIVPKMVMDGLVEVHHADGKTMATITEDGIKMAQA
jgi:hypothetical protein